MDQDVKQISKEGLVAITKATELFIQHVAKECYGVACYTRGSAKRSGGVVGLKEIDVVAGIQSANSLRFLRHDFYAVSEPNPNSEAPSGKRPRVAACADKDDIAAFFKPK